MRRQFHHGSRYPVPERNPPKNNLEDRVATAEARIQALENKLKDGEVRSRCWRKHKQQQDEPEKVVVPTPNRKIASVFTVKTTPPSEQVPVDIPQPETCAVDNQNLKDSEITTEFNDDITQRFDFKVLNENENEAAPEKEAPRWFLFETSEAPKIEVPEEKLVFPSKPVVQETVEAVETADEFDSPLVHSLISMGFSKSSVKKAVEKYYDMESAVEYLLGEY